MLPAEPSGGNILRLFRVSQVTNSRATSLIFGREERPDMAMKRIPRCDIVVSFCVEEGRKNGS